MMKPNWMQHLAQIAGSLKFGLMAICLATLFGCSIPATRIVQKPLPQVAKQLRDAQTYENIRALGRDGDWLVIRGFHATDNAVAFLTNTPFSHAALLNHGADSVIESDASGVHVTSLAAFIQKSHRTVLIRPQWSNASTGPAALAKAQQWVGKHYDFLGLIGFNIPDQFYCSELAIEAYQAVIPKHSTIPRPVQPGELYFLGQVLYDAGAMDEQ